MASQKLLLVENGSLMPFPEKMLLPDGWEDCLVVYRGHGRNVRNVQSVIDRQPGERLGLFFDFDPAGLSLAVAIGKGQLMIPENWEEWIEGESGALSQRSAFLRQESALDRPSMEGASDQIKSVSEAMRARQWGVMQEHLVATEIQLKAISVV